MATSPVVARWELSLRLGARRKELGLDVKAITEELEFTRNYWSAIENDRTLIAAEKLQLACELLQFSDTDRNELLQLREEARAKGWWDEFPSLDDAMKRFYGMEAGASRIRAYDGHFIPGPLQIDPYSRSILEADPFSSPVDIQPRLAVRLRRQEELLGSMSHPMIVLLSEAALRQQAAGRAIQAQQLDHLANLADRGKIELRVLPLAINPGMIANSSTLIFLEYDSDHLMTIAYQEAILNYGYTDETKVGFRALEMAWADGLMRAMNNDDSRQMLEEVSASLR